MTPNGTGVTRNFSELTKTLKKSVRNYEHLTLSSAQVDDPKCLKFFENHKILIKSLKLATCHFRSVATQISFLSIVAPNLEELEFENVIVDSVLFHENNRLPSLSVNFPKLQKLKCGALPGNFICTTLKCIDVYAVQHNRLLPLLKLNPGLEQLTMTYEVLDAAFRRDFTEQGIQLKLKKIHVMKSHSSDPMDTISNRNFQSFLITQRDCLEEFVIDWFSGKPPERRVSNDWFEEPQFRRRRVLVGGENERIRLENRGIQRRRVIDEGFNATEDICVKALQTIFAEFRSIRKLIVADKQGFLSDECPTVGALNIVPNPNIVELRLRFERAPLSNALFEKLVSACPNVKRLFVHEMDQHNLECTSREMNQLESIFALSFKVDTLPCESVKFEKLRKLNFCESFIGNHPEIALMKSVKQKQVVMKMLKQIED